MGFLQSAVLVLHLIVAAVICGFVLLQHGKGADMGAAFGSGSAGSVFGAAGSANFLSRTTAILAALFFATSIALTYFGTQHARSSTGGLMDRVTTEPAKAGDLVPGKTSEVPDKAGAPAVKSDAAPAKAGETPAAPATSPASKSSEVPK